MWEDFDINWEDEYYNWESAVFTAIVFVSVGLILYKTISTELKLHTDIELPLILNEDA